MVVFADFPTANKPVMRTIMSDFILKICPKDLWAVAEQKGVFEGAPIDLADGYIHFSTIEQVRETAAKHFAGQNDLLLIAINKTALGDALKYEVSRGGALFPHLYAHLSLTDIMWVKPLPLGSDGQHIFPDMIP